MAEEGQVTLHTHLLAGHPVRDIVELAAELKVDLLVIGATGHSAVRANDRKSGGWCRATRPMPGAGGEKSVEIISST